MMDVLIYVILKIILIKFVAAKKIYLHEELKSSLDLLALLNESSITPSNGDEFHVPRCCPLQMNLDSKFRCVVSGTPYADPNPNKLNFVCEKWKEKVVMEYSADEPLWISKRNFLLVTEVNPDTNKTIITAYTKFCVDHRINKTVALVCEASSPTDLLFSEIVNPICKFISALLFLTIALIYLLVPKLSKVYGKTIAVYALVTSIEYFWMGLNEFAAIGASTEWVTHFFELSSYSWLLMITIQIIFHVWSNLIYVAIAFLPGLYIILFPTYHTPKQVSFAILFVNFLMFWTIAISKLYKKIKNRKVGESYEKYYEVVSKQRAITILGIYIVTAFNLVTVVWHDLRTICVWTSMWNSLLGVTMAFLFVLIPYYEHKKSARENQDVSVVLVENRPINEVAI